MNASKQQAIETWLQNKAATFYFKEINALDDDERFHLYSEYIKEKVGAAWKKRHQSERRQVFISMEYNLPKPHHEAVHALGLEDDIAYLRELIPMSTEKSNHDFAPKIAFGTLGDFSAQRLYSAAEDELTAMGYGLLLDPKENPWYIKRAQTETIETGKGPITLTPFDYPIVTENNVAFLRLWFAEDKGLWKHRLYPATIGKKGIQGQLLQEYALGEATARDILREDSDFSMTDVWIHETHGVYFLVALYEALRTRGLSHEKIVEKIKAQIRFTSIAIADEVFASYSVKDVQTLVPKALEAIKVLDQCIDNVHLIDGNRIFPYRLLQAFGVAIEVSTKHQKDVWLEKLGSASDQMHAVYYHNPPFPLRGLKEDNNPMTLSHQKQNADAFAKWKARKKAEFLETLEHTQGIRPTSIFISQIASFHENNRILMPLLAIAKWHRDVRENPHVDFPAMTFFFSGTAHKDYWMAKEIQEFVRAYARWLEKDHVTHERLRIVYLDQKELDTERELLKASDIYQYLRHPKHQSASNATRLAIYHGAQVLAAEHDFIASIQNTLGQTGPHFFKESSAPKEAKDILSFLKAHENDLQYSVEKIEALIEQYQDSFSVLGSFSSYEQALHALTTDYWNGKQWEKNRFVARTQLVQFLRQQREVQANEE